MEISNLGKKYGKQTLAFQPTPEYAIFPERYRSGPVYIRWVNVIRALTHAFAKQP